MALGSLWKMMMRSGKCERWFGGLNTRPQGYFKKCRGSRGARVELPVCEDCKAGEFQTVRLFWSMVYEVHRMTVQLWRSTILFAEWLSTYESLPILCLKGSPLFNKYFCTTPNISLDVSDRVKMALRIPLSAYRALERKKAAEIVEGQPATITSILEPDQFKDRFGNLKIYDKTSDTSQFNSQTKNHIHLQRSTLSPASPQNFVS